MVEKIAQHTHCQMCGKAVPIKETVCSEDCKQKYDAVIKKRKWYLYIMYGAIFVIIVVFALSYI